MAMRTITFFQTLQKYYHFVGIIPLRSSQKCPLNSRIVAIFIVLTLQMMSTGAYVFFKAQSPIEKSDTFYFFSTFVGIECAYLVSVWKCADIFAFIENVNVYIHSIVLDDLALKAIYDVIDAKIERMSKIIKFLLVDVAQIGCIFPPAIVTAINYLVYDMGEESYFSVVQMM